MFADFSEEQKLWQKGCEFVVGLDEVGRGPLAGPVVAGAVCIKKSDLPAFVENIRDSKKLSQKQREGWYKFLTEQSGIKWGIGIISEKIIDQINILEATKLAMKKAIKALKVEPDYLLLDGNFLLEDLSISQKAVVRGDEKVISCAAASILAKVTRDRLMEKYDIKYPQYGFKKHKGYGTKDHLAAIKKHGACPIHRISFSPLSRGVHGDKLE